MASFPDKLVVFGLGKLIEYGGIFQNFLLISRRAYLHTSILKIPLKVVVEREWAILV